MKLLKEIRLLNNVYHVTVGLAPKDPEALSPREREVFSQFGDVPIDVGGSFVSSSPSVNFTLPTKTLQFPTQFPFKQTFAIADNANANDRAIVYLDEIVERITDAKDAHLTKNPGILLEDIETV